MTCSVGGAVVLDTRILSSAWAARGRCGQHIVPNAGTHKGRPYGSVGGAGSDTGQRIVADGARTRVPGRASAGRSHRSRTRIGVEHNPLGPRKGGKRQFAPDRVPPVFEVGEHGGIESVFEHQVAGVLVVIPAGASMGGLPVHAVVEDVVMTWKLVWTWYCPPGDEPSRTNWSSRRDHVGVQGMDRALAATEYVGAGRIEREAPHTVVEKDAGARYHVGRAKVDEDALNEGNALPAASTADMAVVSPPTALGSPADTCWAARTGSMDMRRWAANSLLSSRSIGMRFQWGSPMCARRSANAAFLHSGHDVQGVGAAELEGGEFESLGDVELLKQ